VREDKRIASAPNEVTNPGQTSLQACLDSQMNGSIELRNCSHIGTPTESKKETVELEEIKGANQPVRERQREHEAEGDERSRGEEREWERKEEEE
jgi:hypothetical protein